MGNRKILFLMNSMQGYANEIVKELEQKKYEVVYMSDACRINKKNLSFKEKIIKSLAKDFKIEYFSKLYTAIERKKFSEIIEKLNKDFDYLIDFAAGSNPVFMEFFINKNPKTHKILFIWDDLDYHQESKKLLKYFDKTYTYNKNDAIKYNLIYRPSFYLDIFRYSNEKKDINIFYVATMRETKRAEFVSLIDKTSENNNNYIKLIHKLKTKDYVLNRSFLKYKEYYSSKILDVYQLAEYYKKSKVLLDISFTGQTGLGLRPIESLASKCKLITTNFDIKNYDFYNENNIFVVTYDNVLEIKEFLEKPYIEIKDEIKENYKLNKFLDDILKK